MKRVVAVVFASLVVAQLCLLPMAVTAKCLSVSTVTLPVTNITDSIATLKGTWNWLDPDPFSQELCVSFQYGTVPDVYTAETPQVTTSLPVDFQANISGLSPCTTYYVRTQLHFPCSTPKFDCTNYDGNVVSFQTTNPFLEELLEGENGPSSGSSSVTGTTTFAPPVSLPNILVQSAGVSAKSVTPGTPVTVTANLINKSTVNGNKKVTLYVNGQVETTQGITVNSGGSSKLTFNVSRSEPGDYSVYVDGVPAGSFKVELFSATDGILVFSAALVGLAFLIGMVMLWRRRQRAG